MDPRLTRLYQDELTHLRELGREFAREHPKIAKRLELDSIGMEVADPYVERLVEGFAFLAARVQLKMEAEQPQLIAHLLEALYPNFLAPVPSMMIVRLAVDVTDPNLAQGHPVPRSSAVQSLLPRGQDTCCEYRTAMAVTLWPVELLQVRYFSQAPDLGLTRLPAAATARAGLRIRLCTGGGLRFAQLGMDRLVVHISAPDDVAFRLHELIVGCTLGSLVIGDRQTDPAAQWRDATSIQPVGLAEDEALLPESLRVFSGHRLLQEAAALPQRLLFFEVTDLASRLVQVPGGDVELVLLFARADPTLEALVDTESLALFCTPAINLFRKRLDPVALGTDAWEHHAVPDGRRPMDFEVHSLESVSGHGAGRDGPRHFEPLYSQRFERPADGHGYYTLRRAPRRPSERQSRPTGQGARVPTYLGEEVFLSLADPGHGPFREGVRQLSIVAWVTNRDLPVLLPRGASGGVRAWQLDAPGPVTEVTCLRGPTRPVSRQPGGAVAWQLVAQLTKNQLVLGDDALVNAAALRELLKLYGPPNDPAWIHQADGVRALRARHVLRRLPHAGRMGFCSGVAITLEVDEQAFHGASAYLLGSVLEHYFARHAAINSFSQFTLVSLQRGPVRSWPPRAEHDRQDRFEVLS